MMAGREYVCRRAVSGDRPAIMALCRSSLGWSPNAPDEAFFTWKHDDNAFGESPSWVAEASDGMLVGLRVFLRWGFRDSLGHSVSGVRAVDTVTHPDWRGRGVFSALTLGALPDLADEGVAFVFNTPNDKSRPGYLKMGWAKVGKVAVVVRLGSIRGLGRLHRARTSAELWSEPVDAGVSAAEAFGDHDGVEALLAHARRPGGLTTDRSAAFLSWRYRFGPLHYRAFPLGDSLSDGVIVFRARRRGGALEVTVCDVVAPPGTRVGQRVSSDRPPDRLRLSVGFGRFCRTWGRVRSCCRSRPGAHLETDHRRRHPRHVGPWFRSRRRRAVLMRRVLWLAKGLGPGGMERLLVTHASVGDRGKFEYSAAYLVERPHSVMGELEALGVPCTRLGHGRDVDLLWIRELRALVRNRRIDVVHVHSPMVAALARPALRSMRHRPAVVYTEHNSWDCYASPTRVANAATYLLDDAHLAVSSAAARSVASPLRRKVEVLTHGIDVRSVAWHRSERDVKRAELGIGPDIVVVITVANLRHEKGYDVLLAAAVQAMATRPDLLFLSVGQGRLASEMEERRGALGLGDRFRFLGFRDDVHSLLAAADVFCLASRNEGLPVALMEAYAVGVPVVATRVGGLPEVVEDGGSGLLVDPEDPDALAQAIVTLAGDEPRRRQLGQRAVELAAQFDSRVAVRRIEALYDEVIR